MHSACEYLTFISCSLTSKEGIVRPLRMSRNSADIRWSYKTNKQAKSRRRPFMHAPKAPFQTTLFAVEKQGPKGAFDFGRL